MKLVTLANLEGYYYKPRIDRGTIKSLSRRDNCHFQLFAGEIPRLIVNNRIDEAKATLKWYLEVFGEDYYLELQKHINVPELEMVNSQLMKMSREFGVPLVATNDVHYINEDDAEAQDALLAVGTKNCCLTKTVYQ